MASSQYVSFSIFSYLILFGPIAPFPLAFGALPSDTEKVSLALYYESLCPYSADFIINYLVKIFEDDLISIIDLKLVPWGNAKIRGNNTFDCQHGPSECLLNTIEACAIDIWPDLFEHFPFIYCIETLVYDHKYPQWDSCFEKLGLDPKPIGDCYISGRGKELELEYATETNALRPPHEYVPWVVVDGQPLFEASLLAFTSFLKPTLSTWPNFLIILLVLQDYENFIGYVCKAYKGSTVPSACNDLSRNSIVLKENSENVHLVSYAEENHPKETLLSRMQSSIRSWAHQMVDAAAAI